VVSLSLLPLLVALALVLGLVIGLSGGTGTGGTTTAAAAAAAAAASSTTTAASSTTVAASTTGPVTTTTGPATTDPTTTSTITTTTTGTTTGGPSGVRVLAGTVGFTLPVLTTPANPSCLIAPSGFCGGGINVLPYIQGGQGFTVSNAGVRVLQNLPLCTAAETTGTCPQNQMGTISYYDVTFDTPFASLPAVQVFSGTTPLSVASCYLGFTLGFTGTGLAMLPQVECDPTTRFTISVSTAINQAYNVSSTGFTSALYLAWQMCPIGNNTISHDDFCHAIFLFVLQFYDPVLGFFATFSAIGQ
jgi:hypothetical protein